MAMGALALVAASVTLLAPTARATHSPTFVAGNPTCGSLGYDAEFKIEGVPSNGPYTIPVSATNPSGGTLTISNATNFSFDFSSTVPVSAVVVKASNGGNLYTFSPPTTSHTGLQSPNTQSGNQATISHVSFCFGAATAAAELTIEKTAVPSFTRAFDWSIDTSVDQTSIVTAADEATFNYTVVATKGAAQDSGWTVSGVITISNPNTVAVTITSLTDAIEDDPDFADCVLTAPATIGAGATINVDYTCTFESDPTETADSNTARISWTDPNTGQPKDAFFDQSFTWGDPSEVIDDEVDVTDTFNGGAPETLGTVSETTTFGPYPRTVPVPARGCASFSNTATVVETAGSDADNSDTVTVSVCRPTNDGGFTIGFWQNKNGQALLGGNKAGYCAAIAQYTNVLGTVSNCTSGNNLLSYVTGVIKTANSSGDATAMFKAQFLATVLNGVRGGSAFLSQNVSVDGSLLGTDDCISISTLLSAANAAYPFGGNKATVTAVKDYFDLINNNQMSLCVP